MHGDVRCDCAGTANPAIRRSVFSILWSPRRIAVYPTPERFSRKHDDANCSGALMSADSPASTDRRRSAKRDSAQPQEIAPLQFKLTDHRIPVSRSVSCDERFWRKKSTLSPIFRRCPRWSFLRHHLLEDVFGMIGTANEGAGEDPPDAKAAGHFAQVSEFVGMVVFLNFRVLH